jgi:MoaA/NifB/PqqE/SkfB family radical SAM enzyme
MDQIHPEIPTGRISTLFKEAESLGIGVIMIAGGEPLMRPEILEAAAERKKIIFPVFTNGTLLDQERIKFFRKHPHLIPILSVEGNRQYTDHRRGEGVFNMLELSMTQLQDSNQLYGLFISLPGDEEKYGGCLAAGRGFAHISADGSVEPCPFAPCSDLNIRDRSLASALESKFLRKIRESHHLLKESRGGCTLWENRKWVSDQLNGFMDRPA